MNWWSTSETDFFLEINIDNTWVWILTYREINCEWGPHFFFLLSFSEFTNPSLEPCCTLLVVALFKNFYFAALSMGFQHDAVARRAALQLTDNLHQGDAHA